MDLAKKQEDFEYHRPDDLYVHGEPFSPAKWNEQLAKIGGKCPAGDARLRIVWGGTAKKRAYAQTPERSVEVMTIKYPGPIPKIRELVGFMYLTSEGGTVNVARQEQVPRGKIAIPRYDYAELGMLRWVLERKFTPQELIAMEHYPDPTSDAAKTFGVKGGRRYIAPMHPTGEYIALFPLQTPEGRYFEPDDEWFTQLAKRQREIETATEGDKLDFLNRSMDAIDENEKRAAEFEREQRDIIWEETLIEVEKGPQGPVTFDQAPKQLNS